MSFKALSGNLSLSVFKTFLTYPETPYPRIPDPSISTFFSYQEVFSRKWTGWPNQGNQAGLSAGIIFK